MNPEEKEAIRKQADLERLNAWVAANPERVKQRLRERAKLPEEKERKRHWKKANPDYDRQYYLANKAKWRARYDALTPEQREALRAKNRAQYYKHKEKRLAKVREYAQANRDKVLDGKRRYYIEKKPRFQEYRKRNRDRLNKLRLKYYYRDKQDPCFKLARAMRQTMRRIVDRGGNKCAKTVHYLGCSWAEARAHIESKFEPGMTWENHGTAWHIDHIIPLAAFNLSLPQDAAMATRWDNLRPLWKTDNLAKGAKWQSFQSELPIQLTA